MMKISDQQFAIYESEGCLHLSIGENYKYSPTSIVSYLMEIESVKLLAKKSWLLTDDYQSEFRFKDHDFVLCTPGDSVDIFPISENVPNEISQELYQTIKQYKSVSTLKWLSTWFYVLLLPFNYKP